MECLTDLMGGGWKLVDEWTITGGSNYQGTQYVGNFDNFLDYDKVRIVVSGTMSLISDSTNSKTVGYLSLYNGQQYWYTKPSGSLSNTQSVNIVADSFVVRTNDSVTLTPIGSKSSGVYPGYIDAVKLVAIDGQNYISASGLNVKIYVK